MSTTSPIPTNARAKFIQYMELHDDEMIGEKTRARLLEPVAAKWCQNNGLRYADPANAVRQYFRLKKEQ